jgi:predicted permease
MNILYRLRALARRLFRRDGIEQAIDRDLADYVERASAEKMRDGMSDSEARRAALIELGGAEQVKERVREGRAGAALESLARDIRYAMRSLGQARGFSLSVIASLALGLAATIVAFALINGALLRPFPGVQDQDRLVEIGIQIRSPFGWGLRRTVTTDYPEIVRALEEGMPSLDGLASFTEGRVAATLPEPRSLQAAFVSPNYFDVLGVRPEIGRAFAPGEGRIESASVALISRALWIREFGGDPAVVGQPIRAGEQTFTIIGVAPQGFAGTTQNPIEAGVELWLPMVFADLLSVGDSAGSSLGMGFAAAGSNGFNPGRAIRYVGRMADGTDTDRIETELGVAAAGIVASIGDDAVISDASADEVRVAVSGLRRLDLAQAVPFAAVILLTPFLVLVVACVNAANLFLVRASRRGREVAVRLALGASRARLVRQLVLESLILATVAALLALGLGWSGLRLVATYMTFPMPLDGAVVVGALGTALLAALASGLAPAFQATRQYPSAALGTSPAGSGGTRAQSRVRRALVAGQVALSLGLLAIGFQLTSGLESLTQPRGTDPDRMLVVSFDLEELRFSVDESNAFYAALVDRASRLPGVEAAGLTGRDLLWSEFDPANSYVVDPGPEGRGRPDGPTMMGSSYLPVGGSAGGDFFRAVGLDIVQGRDFVESDWRDIPEVAIISERLASELFDGGAVGRILNVTTFDADAPEADVQVVGIVESPVAVSGQDVTAIFFPSPFFPSPFQNGAARTLYVRSEGPAGPLSAAIRDLVAGIDPQVPVLELATLDQKLRADYLFPRVLARAAALVGIVALLLASVGLYGVTSYTVASRAREIAVRMALGARPDRVLALVLRQALTLVLIGSVLGGAVAIVAGSLIQTEIYGVAGVPFATLSGAAALLGVAMLVASILPARRAARLDPNVVLRGE